MRAAASCPSRDFMSRDLIPQERSLRQHLNKALSVARSLPEDALNDSGHGRLPSVAAGGSLGSRSPFTGQLCWWLLMECRTSHTTHNTQHTSHTTLHTSHLTPHTSHLTPHTSHLTHYRQHTTRNTLHLTPHTSHLTPHTSHLTLPSPQATATQAAAATRPTPPTATPRTTTPPSSRPKTWTDRLLLHPPRGAAACHPDLPSQRALAIHIPFPI